MVLCIKSYTTIPYRASTGPKQGFPCVVFPHREKPVFITGNPCSHCKDPCFHYRDFPVRKLHRENPVFITGNGFAVKAFLIFLQIQAEVSLSIQ